MKNTAGRSIFELVAYMGAVVAISMSAMKLYANYTAKIKRTKADAQISELAEEARLALFGKKSIMGEITSTLEEKEIGVIDPWGNRVEIFAGQCIEIRLNSLSKANCIYLAQAIPGNCRGYKTSANGIGQDAKSLAPYLGNCEEGEGNDVRFYWTRK